MILFYADIDNTLIYSYKHNIGSDTIGVEFYPEKNQMISFMSKKSWDLLQKIAERVTVVPTTTRTIEQYNRIDFGITPAYALVCNGGVLLENGQVNKEWQHVSQKLVEPSAKEMKHAAILLEKDENRCFALRDIQGLLLFTKSKKPQETVERLRNTLDMNRVDVFHNKTKVYVVPKKMDKGTACRRLQKKLYANYTIAAGDSEFDIPMFSAVDIAFAPKQLCDAYDIKVEKICDEQKNLFSEYILNCIWEYTALASDTMR